ncbi:pentapeptide repeat-containing protein [Saccharopolyspora sp. K220]|uniref:pentapeptide repeat-containing protein n=1 Tax=Saccharopolyspora soli TaxID=2926618 RepID=UPI001F57BE33|nr:pentapeptide repeat-containing protein [Saccharopolyspora soli]MCI2420232.1 pentapeptide repeat-containing protein [Saccharopolyspora soli]
MGFSPRPAQACIRPAAGNAASLVVGAAHRDRHPGHHDVWFDFAELRDASFSRTEFQKAASFGEAEFHGGARFNDAKFHGRASFLESTFGSTAPSSMTASPVFDARCSGFSLFRSTNTYSAAVGYLKGVGQRPAVNTSKSIRPIVNDDE